MIAMHDKLRASNIDWEDVAIAADKNGVFHIFFGDIVDNAKGRDHITVYELKAPAVTGDGTTAELTDVTAHPYAYSDAANNAKA